MTHSLKRRIRLTAMILGAFILLLIGLVAIDYFAGSYIYDGESLSIDEFRSLTEQVDSLHCVQDNTGLPLLPDYVCFDTPEEAQAFSAQRSAGN